jgi:hypothetical protein
MTQHKFTVKLIGHPGSEGAALKPPFDAVAVFHRKGRVPVKGTINGFPFRSSLMNMGEGHMMVVNAQLRAGARCRAGDTVLVLMELDEDKRTVELPGTSEGSSTAIPGPRNSGPASPSRIRRNMCEKSRPRKNRRPAKNASPP